MNLEQNTTRNTITNVKTVVGHERRQNREPKTQLSCVLPFVKDKGEFIIANNKNCFNCQIYSISLRNPSCVLLDNNDDIIVADTGNNQIKKIIFKKDPTSRIVEKKEHPHKLEETKVKGGYICDICGRVYDSFKITYRCRQCNYDECSQCFKVPVGDTITLEEKVIYRVRIVTVAGNGVQGYQDGSASQANFFMPEEIVMDNNGDFIISDSFNHRIRKWIVKEDRVATIAGNYEKKQIAPLLWPTGLAIDKNGDIIIADSGNHRIRKLDVIKEVLVTIAGTGERGYRDGTALQSQFNWPRGIAIDNNKDIFIVDSENNRIRKFIINENKVVTVAGSGERGFKDGNLLSSIFNWPVALAIDKNGDIIVSDWLNHRIRKLIINEDKVVTIAGTGEAGMIDANPNAMESRFRYPKGLLIDKKGDIIVADSTNNRIRKLVYSERKEIFIVENS